MTSKDKRPDSRKLISSFEDPHADDSFTGERTIPGDYSSLSEVTDHGHEPAFDTGLAEFADPALDGEFADRTQTDIMAVPAHTDVHEAQSQMDALLLDCLRTLDDIDGLVDAARAQDADPKLIVDIEMVRKRFLGKLADYGVEHQPVVGTRVDPSRHEVAREVTMDGDSIDRAVHQAIVAVEREGYTRHGQVLRRARVVVGRPES